MMDSAEFSMHTQQSIVVYLARQMQADNFTPVYRATLLYRCGGAVQLIKKTSSKLQRGSGLVNNQGESFYVVSQRKTQTKTNTIHHLDGGNFGRTIAHKPSHH